MQSMLPEIVTCHAVRDLLNESFNEKRRSFKNLSFDKGSFSIPTSNRSIHKVLRKNKSNRNSFKSSLSTDLGFISEDGRIEEERDSQDDEDNQNNMHASKESLMMETTMLEDELLPVTDEENEDDDESTTMGGKNFMDLFVLGAELGSGAYAVVKEGTHKATKKSYAIKIVEVANMDEFDLDALEIEINVMSRLCHPNIVRLYNTYKTTDFYYLVTEKMVGGELLDRIVQKTFYNEKEARDTCKILFQAMQYCHERQIAHRDLKPENLLLTSTENDSDLKIADFGFAKKCPPTGLRTMCGTPGYVAPEILERTPYNTQCDLWSLGVIVYILLGGYSPFEEQSQEVLFKKIRAGQYEFHDEFWNPVSDDAKDLIRKLLNINPKKRLTATTALQHPWMTMSDDWLMNQDLGVNLTGLKRFNAKRKLKAAVKTVIATQKILALF